MGSPSFHHEALLYAGDRQFVAGTLRFLAPAVAAGAPALVMAGRAKLDVLVGVLAGAATVDLVDMEEEGRNPAWLIPAWRWFVDGHPDSDVWGIGEPVWPGRTPAELVECRHHEMLLNLEFAGRAGFHLLCPYDVARLPPSVVEDACATHPVVSRDGGAATDSPYAGVGDGTWLLREPLPPPPATAVQIQIDAGDLAAARRHVEALGAAVGLSRAEAKDLALAVDEVATNSERHGGGLARLVAWLDLGSLVCEVRDPGWLTDPMAGRRRPPPSQIGGRGLWIANRLCDLVQVRSSPAGTVVRLHKRRRL